MAPLLKPIALIEKKLFLTLTKTVATKEGLRTEWTDPGKMILERFLFSRLKKI